MKPIQRRRSEYSSFALKALCAAVAAVFAETAAAQALPAGPTATRGTADVATTGPAMTVTTSERAIIDWRSFNIGYGASVTFAQPGASSIAVNRVGPTAGASAIDGMLNANGHVMILNPNGIMFGATASVNVGGLIASTGNINDALFMSSSTAPFAITGATTGSISNQGHITLAGAGLAAFVAPSVSNSGTITATSGRIVLASAQAATISLNGLYEIAVDTGVANGTITNTGMLSAAGGTIVLSALDAANLVSGAINLEGVQQASRIEVNGGHVVLKSDLNAAVVTGTSGTIDVCSCGHIQDGIDIAATGATVNVSAGTYAEQLSITKSLSLLGEGASQTFIAPTALVADAAGMKSILTIGGGPATDAQVSGFTIKGPVPEINAGIFVRDGASAHIHDNSLINIRESTALSGNQRGIGIFVGRALLNTSGTAVIENNVITGYQKGGIVVDGPGSQATITGNTVTGEGPTGVTAQNGIQVGRGASATISGNTISGNAYTGADEATGILIFTPGVNLGQGSITVGPNNVSGNQVGVWTNDPRTLATISLAGVAGNTLNGVTRNGVADFGGGFAGQGPLLDYPAWSAASTAFVSSTVFSGAQSGDIRDVGGALGVSGWSGFTAIQPAINAVAAGGTVNVAAGTYTQTTTLNVNKSITLAGAGEASTTIDARTVSNNYGMLVNADHVWLRDFTFYGPTANVGNAYGIKVQPAGSAASSRLLDFNITNVTSRGAGRAELDLNGVVGATIDHFTADGAPVGGSGTTAGAGIQVTDSANVTISNSTTRNNAWGGVALFQSNRFFNQQTTGITVQNNNTLTESNPLYLQNDSVSGSFGALTLLGFNYAVRNPDVPSTNYQFTWMQPTAQGAFDLAVNLLHPELSYAQGWSGTALTQDFSVGVGHLAAGGSTRNMSIMTAIDQSATGATVAVGSGTYAESVVLDGMRNLTFDGATIQGLTINPGAAGSGIGGNVTANTPGGFMFNAPVVLLSNTALGTTGANIALNGDIQGAGGSPFALSLMAGTGDIALASGGTPGAPLGHFDSTSLDLSLSGTLWVTGFNISASGNVALSDHSLHATLVGLVNTIGASGSVAGTAVSASPLTVDAGGDVSMNIAAPGGSVHAGGQADINNIGSSVIDVNGKPMIPEVATVDPIRLVPSGSAIAGNSAANSTERDRGAATDAPNSLPVSSAGEALDRGRSVEIDLTPGYGPGR
jgi:filamentous hemagglutinin family protein